ncbi:MAG: hypothetical protein ABI599_09055 [Flavobacteriales bacterium]
MGLLLWCRDILVDVSRLLWPTQVEVVPDPNQRALGVLAFGAFFAAVFYLVGDCI